MLCRLTDSGTFSSVRGGLRLPLRGTGWSELPIVAASLPQSLPVRMKIRFGNFKCPPRISPRVLVRPTGEFDISRDTIAFSFLPVDIAGIKLTIGFVHYVW